MPDINFFFSIQALAISVAAASTSAFSSMLVMAIILRSQSRLSTTYHIIMFFMSFWDLISSAATALVTFPMPSDVYDVYPFSGYAIGTSRTCTAQGFLIVAGQGFATSSIVALNLYYLFTFRYGVSDEILKKRLLPIVLAGAIIIVFLPIAVYPLYLDLFNPRPYEPYCLVGQYPEQCKLKGIECIGGDVSTETFLIWWWSTMIGIGTGFLLVFVSLVLVIMSIYHSERDMKKNATRQNRESKALDERSIQSTLSLDHQLEKEYERTRKALRVSLLYVGAFFLTWIWTILTMALGGKIRYGVEVYDKIVDTAKLIFNPLQGFFNALIFIYDKVCMVKSSKDDLTFMTALKIVLFFPQHIPEVVLTSIELVTRDLNVREESHTPVDVDVQKNAIDCSQQDSQRYRGSLEKYASMSLSFENEEDHEAYQIKRLGVVGDSIPSDAEDLSEDVSSNIRLSSGCELSGMSSRDDIFENFSFGLKERNSDEKDFFVEND